MLLDVHVDDQLSAKDTHQGASIEGSAGNLLPKNPQEKPTGHETTAVLLLLFYPKCAEPLSFCAVHRQLLSRHERASGGHFQHPEHHQLPPALPRGII